MQPKGKTSNVKFPTPIEQFDRYKVFPMGLQNPEAMKAKDVLIKRHGAKPVIAKPYEIDFPRGKAFPRGYEHLFKKV